jgi:uncharacterized repeat protein (TIGR03847 family)
MATHIELNPLSHLTIDTIGEPGNRTFYLQGSQAGELVTLVIEKQQAAALAESFESLLEELGKQDAEIRRVNESTVYADLTLRQPVEELFRVGSLSLGFSEEAKRIVIVAYELVADDDEPNVVSFWAEPRQVKALINQTTQVVKSGRPICGNCGEPIDASGHWCAQRNGHKH